MSTIKKGEHAGSPLHTIGIFHNMINLFFRAMF